MNVEITGRHIEITPAIRSYVLKRLRKFGKFFGENTSIHVIIDVEKERHTAEILLKSKYLNLTGKGETDDMYASIVRAIERLERQADKCKGRLIETKRQKARTRSVEKRSGSARVRSSARSRPKTAIVEEVLPHRPMAVEEAVAELEQSRNGFVVFHDSESGSMNVLYRRKDGSLGLIQE